MLVSKLVSHSVCKPLAWEPSRMHLKTARAYDHWGVGLEPLTLKSQA